MKIIDIDGMTNNGKSRIYHDGKDFIIVCRHGVKIDIWRNGKKIGDIKLKEDYLDPFLNSLYITYLQKSGCGLIVGFKKSTFAFKENEALVDFSAYIVGEQGLIPIYVKYTQDDCKNVARYRRDGLSKLHVETFIIEKKRKDIEDRESCSCKTQDYIIVTYDYFGGFENERFKEFYGVEMKENQLMFFKNGHFHFFTLEGFSKVFSPCVSEDGLTLAVLATENKKTKLVIIDLDL